ncbi:MAG: hypothetical protein KF729_08980 [Sandaracinaceae bacterium]|nr:hypothetical protein [Sandaracinaceae bacterium]
MGAVYLGLDREQPELTKTAATLLNAVLGWESAKRLAVGAPHRDGQPKTVWQSGDARVDIVLPYYASQVRARLEGGEEPNPSSVVLRLVRGNTAILVGGDAPLGSWERLEPELLPARLIRAPHHGGRIDEGRVTWTEDTLYERVGAATVVVSVGTHNGHEHPTDDHLRAIRVDRRRLLCTQLTPRCHADPAALRPGLRTRLAGGVLPYRHLHPSRQEVPCAGSVVAWLEPGDALEVEPAPGGPHDAFVAAVDHPRCRAT